MLSSYCRFIVGRSSVPGEAGCEGNIPPRLSCPLNKFILFERGIQQALGPRALTINKLPEGRTVILMVTVAVDDGVEEDTVN